MTHGTSQEHASLLDVLIDGFEKNEVLRGFHWRDLPMPDGEAAERKFESFCDEATRWKGPPPRLERSRGRRLAAWPDIEIRQAGRGVMILVRAPSFPWWHERATWEGEPMQALHEWLGEDVP